MQVVVEEWLEATSGSPNLNSGSFARSVALVCLPFRSVCASISVRHSVFLPLGLLLLHPPSFFSISYLDLLLLLQSQHVRRWVVFMWAPAGTDNLDALAVISLETGFNVCNMFEAATVRCKRDASNAPHPQLFCFVAGGCWAERVRWVGWG